MSGWGRDYDDEPALSLGDIERGLEGEDRATFAALLMKGMAAIEEDEGGLVQRLREEILSLKRTVGAYQGKETGYKNALEVIRQKDALIERMRRLPTAENAAALLTENEQLRERVEIQRQIIGRFERSATASPWQMFKDGLSSVFADPLTAVANAKV